MIEHSHLKIIQALHDNGTLTAAANALCLTQSALSHQIRYLEKKLEVTLWEREGRSLRLTQAGEQLLKTAQQLLPVLEQTEQTLKAYGAGRQGILRIGVECYPCYQWLSGLVGQFLAQMPDIEIDIINKFQFSGLEGLLNHHIDLLITPDMEKEPRIDYETLAKYEMVLLVSEGHPLTKLDTLSAEDFSDLTLYAFPVPPNRLDILTQFLNPACIKPARIKHIESIELMLQMVALGRGVCVLPEWLATPYLTHMPLKKIRIGLTGIYKKLFFAVRKKDRGTYYIEQFITTGKNTADKTLHTV